MAGRHQGLVAGCSARERRASGTRAAAVTGRQGGTAVTARAAWSSVADGRPGQPGSS
ncbi:hypothetical protein ATKI12_4549 [Kitasatospora sp. Ki12]